MDTPHELTELRNAVRILFESVIDLQSQQDETSVLQLAMYAVLQDRVSDFEIEVEKRKAFYADLVREQNEQIRRELRERLGKWIQ